jgi:predicted TIM-barrel fold metal-dependent hydrolase
MIFDSITHVTPDGRWFHTGHDASESRLLQQLDAARVEHAVVVALAGHISNEFVLDVCQRHRPRLIPGASFNPVAYPTAVAAAREFRTQLQGSPFQLLKLHPRLNRYDPLEPRCRAVLEEIASWPKPLPVWLDTLFYFATGSSRKPVVDTIHDLGISFPGIPFVMLHGGGSWILQVAEAICDCPNVYLDISFTLLRQAGSSVEMDLRYLLKTFDRRMVFGSDFPEIDIPHAVQSFERLADGVAPEKSAGVLGGNLHRLLMEGKP